MSDLTTQLSLFLDSMIAPGGMIIAGNGSPEGIIAGHVGWLYTRLDNAGQLYVKTSGTGNTGWVALASVTGVGGAGINTTITTGDLVGKTITVTGGLITGFA